MSFSTMNGVNAARSAGGLAGTRRQAFASPVAQPQMQPPPQQPTAQIQPHVWRGPPTGGTGMAGSSPHGGFSQLAGPGKAPQALGASQDAGGVNPGMQQQAPLQGPPPVQFDPNDPNNAALAGYMNG